MTAALDAIRALDDGKHRAEFYDMWRTMYSAGFPHPKTFETMGVRQSALTEQIRLWLLVGTKRRRSIADLVKAGGTRFEEFERALLTLGEESGRLDQCLRLLSAFYMKKYLLMLWVKKKMVYPFVTGFFACLIAPVPLLVFGHPRVYFALAGSGIAAILFGSGAIVAATSAHYGRKAALVRAGWRGRSRRQSRPGSRCRVRCVWRPTPPRARRFWRSSRAWASGSWPRSPLRPHSRDART